MQDGISKIRNFLPIEPSLIQFGGIANDNYKHDILKYFSWAAFPFNVTRHEPPQDLRGGDEGGR